MRTSSPVFQVWHGEVPANEAHLQTDDLSVLGGRGAAVLGRAGVLAAAVAGRLRADAVPRQVGHQRRFLEERRNFPDVLDCWERRSRMLIVSPNHIALTSITSQNVFCRFKRNTKSSSFRLSHQPDVKLFQNFLQYIWGVIKLSLRA